MFISLYMSDRALTVINVVALAVIVMFPLLNINDDIHSFKLSFIQYGNPTALQYRSEFCSSAGFFYICKNEQLVN